MIWFLLLTVCMNDGKCHYQNVGLYDSREMCIASKNMHEELPIDGLWTSVNYECKLMNGEEV
ncbi:MAG: hypothetical protein CBD57_04555 [Candidatus Pelagibacter sp. TMED197]|nr:MAG: hypothetical protein CBD57_04555 [Candidatus Pelagibacter sp. TMED197]|tara:strand:+ start:5473 stop:5658 length:186 start_codon:yes stop_codon:yes gene_type:complete